MANADATTHHHIRTRPLLTIKGSVLAETLEAVHGVLVAKPTELTQLRREHDELRRKLEAAQNLVHELEQDRAAILAHERHTETWHGWAKLGLRLFLGNPGYAAFRRLYHLTRGIGAASPNVVRTGVVQLAKSPGFLVHLVARIPVALREDRLPRRPGDVLPRLQASFQNYAREPRLRLPGARRSDIRRILFLSHNLNPEGAPLSLLSLSSRLDKRLYEPWILAMEDGPLRARYEAAGVPVEVMNPLREVHTGQLYRDRVNHVAQWVQRSGFELVFCNTLMCFWGVTVARTSGLPSVWCIRESVDWQTYFNYLDPDVAKAALDCFELADRLIFVADATRRLYPAPPAPSQVHTIHNGLDVAAIEAFKRGRSREAIRSAKGIPDGARVISVIGTTCERKGQIDFLRVAATLRPKFEGLHFYVVGAREDAYLTRLMSVVRDHGLSSVVFVPETPDVYEYFRMSDLFVCCSYEESFPRVILEAMAFELPIVSTNVFGIPEAIRDDWSGILVEPGDVPGLASGVARLLDDPDLAKQFAANAYATLVKRFSVDQMVRQYERVFSQIG